MCAATFYFESGVTTHLAHAHGKNADESYVRSINTVVNNGELGINSSTTPQHQLKVDVNGINMSNPSMDLNVNVNGGNTSKEPDNIPISIKPGNDNAATDSTPPKPEGTIQPNNTAQPTVNSLNSVNPPDQVNETNVGSTLLVKKKNWNHKQRPKSLGKHIRPQPVKPKVTSPQVDQTGMKPQFVTVTHGLCKSKKIRRFNCNKCKESSQSQV